MQEIRKSGSQDDASEDAREVVHTPPSQRRRPRLGRRPFSVKISHDVGPRENDEPDSPNSDASSSTADASELAERNGAVIMRSTRVPFAAGHSSEETHRLNKTPDIMKQQSGRQPTTLDSEPIPRVHRQSRHELRSMHAKDAREISNLNKALDKDSTRREQAEDRLKHQNEDLSTKLDEAKTTVLKVRQYSSLTDHALAVANSEKEQVQQAKIATEKQSRALKDALDVARERIVILSSLHEDLSANNNTIIQETIAKLAVAERIAAYFKEEYESLKQETTALLKEVKGEVTVANDFLGSLEPRFEDFRHRDMPGYKYALETRQLDHSISPRSVSQFERETLSRPASMSSQRHFGSHEAGLDEELGDAWSASGQSSRTNSGSSTQFTTSSLPSTGGARVSPPVDGEFPNRIVNGLVLPVSQELGRSPQRSNTSESGSIKSDLGRQIAPPTANSRMLVITQVDIPPELDVVSTLSADPLHVLNVADKGTSTDGIPALLPSLFERDLHESEAAPTESASPKNLPTLPPTQNNHTRKPSTPLQVFSQSPNLKLEDKSTPDPGSNKIQPLSSVIYVPDTGTASEATKMVVDESRSTLDSQHQLGDGRRKGNPMTDQTPAETGPLTDASKEFGGVSIHSYVAEESQSSENLTLSLLSLKDVTEHLGTQAERPSNRDSKEVVVPQHSGQALESDENAPQLPLLQQDQIREHIEQTKSLPKNNHLGAAQTLTNASSKNSIMPFGQFAPSVGFSFVRTLADSPSDRDADSGYASGPVFSKSENLATSLPSLDDASSHVSDSVFSKPDKLTRSFSRTPPSQYSSWGSRGSSHGRPSVLAFRKVLEDNVMSSPEVKKAMMIAYLDGLESPELVDLAQPPGDPEDAVSWPKSPTPETLHLSLTKSAVLPTPIALNVNGLGLVHATSGNQWQAEENRANETGGRLLSPFSSPEPRFRDSKRLLSTPPSAISPLNWTSIDLSPTPDSLTGILSKGSTSTGSPKLKKKVSFEHSQLSSDNDKPAPSEQASSEQTPAGFSSEFLDTSHPAQHSEISTVNATVNPLFSPPILPEKGEFVSEDAAGVQTVTETQAQLLITSPPRHDSEDWSKGASLGIKNIAVTPRALEPDATCTPIAPSTQRVKKDEVDKPRVEAETHDRLHAVINIRSEHDLEDPQPCGPATLEANTVPRDASVQLTSHNPDPSHRRVSLGDESIMAIPSKLSYVGKDWYAEVAIQPTELPASPVSFRGHKKSHSADPVYAPSSNRDTDRSHSLEAFQKFALGPVPLTRVEAHRNEVSQREIPVLPKSVRIEAARIDENAKPQPDNVITGDPNKFQLKPQSLEDIGDEIAVRQWPSAKPLTKAEDLSFKIPSTVEAIRTKVVPRVPYMKQPEDVITTHDKPIFVPDTVSSPAAHASLSSSSGQEARDLCSPSLQFQNPNIARPETKTRFSGLFDAFRSLRPQLAGSQPAGLDSTGPRALSAPSSYPKSAGLRARTAGSPRTEATVLEGTVMIDSQAVDLLDLASGFTRPQTISSGATDSEPSRLDLGEQQASSARVNNTDSKSPAFDHAHEIIFRDDISQTETSPRALGDPEAMENRRISHERSKAEAQLVGDDPPDTPASIKDFVPSDTPASFEHIVQPETLNSHWGNSLADKSVPVDPTAPLDILNRVNESSKRNDLSRIFQGINFAESETEGTASGPEVPSSPSLSVGRLKLRHRPQEVETVFDEDSLSSIPGHSDSPTQSCVMPPQPQPLVQSSSPERSVQPITLLTCSTGTQASEKHGIGTSPKPRLNYYAENKPLDKTWYRAKSHPMFRLKIKLVQLRIRGIGHPQDGYEVVNELRSQGLKLFTPRKMHEDPNVSAPILPHASVQEISRLYEGISTLCESASQQDEELSLLGQAFSTQDEVSEPGEEVSRPDENVLTSSALSSHVNAAGVSRPETEASPFRIPLLPVHVRELPKPDKSTHLDPIRTVRPSTTEIGVQADLAHRRFPSLDRTQSTKEVGTQVDASTTMEGDALVACKSTVTETQFSAGTGAEEIGTQIEDSSSNQVEAQGEAIKAAPTVPLATKPNRPAQLSTACQTLPSKHYTPLDKPLPSPLNKPLPPQPSFAHWLLRTVIACYTAIILVVNYCIAALRILYEFGPLKHAMYGFFMLMLIATWIEMQEWRDGNASTKKYNQVMSWRSEFWGWDPLDWLRYSATLYFGWNGDLMV